MQKIPCAIELPDVFRAKAWYALRMLLLPFRVEPILVDRSELEDVSIYYGNDTDGLSDATWKLKVHESTWDHFQKQAQPDTLSIRHVRVGDQRIPVLFSAGGEISFDPVASTFYFLSGWQEIVIRKRDEHGRFPFEASIQNKLNVRATPVVEWYRFIAADALRKRGAKMDRRQYAGKDWAFCSTHDIDYDRKWRPGIYKREIFDRVILNKEKETASTRFRRLLDVGFSLLETKDPYRLALGRIRSELESREAKGTFFYKVAAHGSRDSRYDLHGSHVLGEIKRQIREGHEIGMHPSYHSYSYPTRLAIEKSKLEFVTQIPTASFRAHYLRHDHPQSMHILNAAGFSIDSTLGFSECGGFRFGTCLPFPLYDPQSDIETEVWEFPLCMMESALFNRQNLSRVDAERETNQLIQSCATFGGTFVGLWHNILWDERDFPGWGAHFLSSLDEGTRLSAHFGTLSGVLSSWK